MKRIFLAVLIACIFAGAAFTEEIAPGSITSMDQVIYLSYTKGGKDQDFPKTGNGQMEWFAKRGELFPIKNDIDLERITRFGTGDVIYLTDADGNYLHCFMVNNYDKATNRFTMLGALHAGDSLGLYGDKNKAVKKLTISRVMKMDIRWKKAIVGSKHSKWLETAPSMDAAVSSSLDSGEAIALREWDLSYVLPTSDWSLDDIQKGEKLVLYQYTREPINDNNGIQVTPTIGIIYEKVVSGYRNVSAYAKHKLALAPLTGAKELKRGILRITNAKGYTGYMTDNTGHMHRIYNVFTLRKGIGTQIIIDSTVDIAPHIEDEANSFLSSLSYLK